MKAESNVIEIGEYKYEDIQGLNIPKDVNYLDKFFKSTPCKVTEIKDNKVRAENTSYAGIIQLDKTRIHFSTKVKSNLFYMLSFLKDEKEFHFDSDIIIDIKEGQNFFDILGRLFLNELEEIFKKGFYKKYVRKEENLSFLKGKMLFSKQLINDIRKTPKFYCSYEDLTYDNLENQIVLKATALLIPLIRFNDKIKSELIRYRYILNEEVILRNVLPEECNRVQYNKLNECYEPIIQFSRAVLQYHFIRSAHKGASKGFNFIVNMNRVYEDFITEIVKELINEDPAFTDYIVEAQKRFDSLVKEREVVTKPDVILRKKNSSEYPLLIDTKYKRQENNADYYQVIAYALAIKTVETCLLIYPATDEKDDIRELTIDRECFELERPDIKIYTIRVNLFLDESLEFKEYIGKIKEGVKDQLINYL
jgi:5-methylcytosine-specific restriction enzyme subunit McrC|tara:strand:+ start:2691 stop:3956 length:1266 start_codon:yes stop_codon:yes gene_type:complete